MEIKSACVAVATCVGDQHAVPILWNGVVFSRHSPLNILYYLSTNFSSLIFPNITQATTIKRAKTDVTAKPVFRPK